MELMIKVFREFHNMTTVYFYGLYFFYVIHSMSLSTRHLVWLYARVVFIVTLIVVAND